MRSYAALVYKEIEDMLTGATFSIEALFDVKPGRYIVTRWDDAEITLVTAKDVAGRDLTAALEDDPALSTALAMMAEEALTRVRASVEGQDT